MISNDGTFLIVCGLARIYKLKPSDLTNIGYSGLYSREYEYTKDIFSTVDSIYYYHCGFTGVMKRTSEYHEQQYLITDETVYDTAAYDGKFIYVSKNKIVDKYSDNGSAGVKELSLDISAQVSLELKDCIVDDKNLFLASDNEIIKIDKDNLTYNSKLVLSTEGFTKIYALTITNNDEYLYFSGYKDGNLRFCKVLRSGVGNYEEISDEFGFVGYHCDLSGYKRELPLNLI